MESGDLRLEILIPSTPSINLHVLILKNKCFQNNPLHIDIFPISLIPFGTFNTQARLNFHHDTICFDMLECTPLEYRLEPVNYSQLLALQYIITSDQYAYQMPL